MKPLILWICFQALIASTFAQLRHEAILKGDNIIVIETSFGADSSFIECSKYLVQKGYSFQSRDASLGQIVTNERSYAGAFNFRLNIVCLKGEVKIRASVQLMSLAMQLVWTDWY